MIPSRLLKSYDKCLVVSQMLYFSGTAHQDCFFRKKAISDATTLRKSSFFFCPEGFIMQNG